MNMRAGSKKFIKLVAAAGTVVSSITKTENIQNIPNNALGNFIEAATKAFFKNLSIARTNPSETTKCNTPNIFREIVEVEMLLLSEAEDLTEIVRSELVSRGSICKKLELGPRTLMGNNDFLGTP